jgi:hypothetical protein
MHRSNRIVFFWLECHLSNGGRPSLERAAVLLACIAGATCAAWPVEATAESTCRRWSDGGERMGRLEHEAIDESSGLARSRRHDHLLWTHNDSGGEARLFAVDTRDASHRGVARLEGVDATDWEDAATGPCRVSKMNVGDDVPSCLYVADIGDNGDTRDHVSIVVFPEPDLPDDPSGETTVPASSIATISFVYPDGPRDAEVLLVHPSSGRIYVVAKTGSEDNGVYRVPAHPAPPDAPHEATLVGALELPHAMSYGRMATAGDIAPSGREVTLRSYLSLFTFCVSEDEPFETIFDRSPATASPPLSVQSEALAYGSGGDVLWTTSERRPTPLFQLEPIEPGGDSADSGANPTSNDSEARNRARSGGTVDRADLMDCSHAPGELPSSWWSMLVWVWLVRRRERW